MSYLKTVFLATSLIFAGYCPIALSDDAPRDSSADSAGFIQDIQNAQGVVLRVPINGQGEENVAEAVLRIDLKSTQVTAGSDLPTIWGNSKSVDDSPQLNADSPTDSSTWGWYGHRGYRGWAQPYYYRSYSPSAYYYGSQYSYSTRYYSSYYYPSTSYGYRYYYYGCDY